MGSLPALPTQQLTSAQSTASVRGCTGRAGVNEQKIPGRGDLNWRARGARPPARPPARLPAPPPARLPAPPPARPPHEAPKFCCGAGRASHRPQPAQRLSTHAGRRNLGPGRVCALRMRVRALPPLVLPQGQQRALRAVSPRAALVSDPAEQVRREALLACCALRAPLARQLQGRLRLLHPALPARQQRQLDFFPPCALQSSMD